jgi:uncharacterized protein (TIGR03435 family)
MVVPAGPSKEIKVTRWIALALLPVMGSLLDAPRGHAQAAAKRMEFEVASVKTSAMDHTKLLELARSGGRVGNGVYGDRAEYIYRTLRQLIVEAYKVLPFQVVGPDWLTTERFDVICKMPVGSREEDAPLMLQSLLADRFKLVAHRGLREQGVSALVVAKGGPKLKESTSEGPLGKSGGNAELPGKVAPKRSDGSAGFAIGTVGYHLMVDEANCSVHLVGDGMTMAQLAAELMNDDAGDGRPVVDMTGLNGTYQVVLDIPFAAMPGMVCATRASVPETASDPGGGLMGRTLKSLGLELENRRAPVELLIVDHVEKRPTEN